MVERVPTQDYIENLWQSVNEGLITWGELRDLQAAYLRDHAHVPLNRPALFRRQVSVNIDRWQLRANAEPENSVARAMLNYWQQQQERASVRDVKGWGE